MSFTINDSLADMKEAREYLKRHVATMPEAYWDTRTVPHCNSPRQIFAHLFATDRAVFDMLKGKAFDMKRHSERHEEASQEIALKSPAEIISLYDATGEAIATYIRENHGTDAPDTPLTLWGSEDKMAVQLGRLSQETAYHTGQLSLLRQIAQHDWDYFGEVFGAS